MSSSKYLREKATKLRERYNGSHLIPEGRRQRLPTKHEIAAAQFAARQLEIAAEEIEADFHIEDEES